jgi:hypothetical protein
MGMAISNQSAASPRASTDRSKRNRLGQSCLTGPKEARLGIRYVPIALGLTYQMLCG